MNRPSQRFDFWVKGRRLIQLGTQAKVSWLAHFRTQILKQFSRGYEEKTRYPHSETGHSPAETNVWTL